MTRRCRVTLLLAAGALAAASGCDAFFELRGTVSDCGSGAPIAAARVVAAVDPSYASETGSYETDAAGRYTIHLNKPPSAPVTITFSKTGFSDLSRHFNGIPTTPYVLDVCLPPGATSPSE